MNGINSYYSCLYERYHAAWWGTWQKLNGIVFCMVIQIKNISQCIQKLKITQDVQKPISAFLVRHLLGEFKDVLIDKICMAVMLRL